MRPAERLGREKYVSLTTYRRSGAPVATPVWVVGDGARLLVWTAATTGKAKRISHTPRVAVAACDARGRVNGPTTDASARIVPDEEPGLRRRIRAKYRLAAPLLLLYNRIVRAVRRRPPGQQVAIEITFD